MMMNKTALLLMGASLVLVLQSLSWAQDQDVGKTEYVSSFSSMNIHGHRHEAGFAASADTII